VKDISDSKLTQMAKEEAMRQCVAASVEMQVLHTILSSEQAVSKFGEEGKKALEGELVSFAVRYEAAMKVYESLETQLESSRSE